MTNLICGIDEVGRGSWAGPLLSVAALFRGHDPGCPEITDSKKLSPEKRKRLFKMISCSPFLVDFGIGQVDAHEINERGINWANEESFVRAVGNLRQKPSYIIVDGNNGVRGWHPQQVHYEPKADLKFPVVSAASILAKVIRDDYMTELDLQYPGYDWSSNKGYGTATHRKGLEELGATPFHRTKFISKIVMP